MATLEEIGTDASTADGYIVIYSHDIDYDVVLAVPKDPPRGKNTLPRFARSFTSFPLYRKFAQGFKVDSRTVKGKGVPTVYEIAFAVLKNNDKVIELFVECARQSRVIKNPIVSDMRNFNWK